MNWPGRGEVWLVDLGMAAKVRPGELKPANIGISLPDTFADDVAPARPPKPVAKAGHLPSPPLAVRR